MAYTSGINQVGSWEELPEDVRINAESRKNDILGGSVFSGGTSPNGEAIRYQITPNQGGVNGNVNQNTDASGEQTINNILGYIPQNNTDYDTAVQAYRDSLNTPEMTDEQIRQKTQERMQAQIDALDRYYAEQISRENVAGQGRLGESSAIQARRGLIGSDFGQAQTATTQNYNTGVVNAINAEKTAKIQNILSEGRKDVVAEATAKLEAKKAGAKEYLSFLAGEQERKSARVSATVSNLVNGGVEPTDEDLKTLATQLGVSVQELKAQYNAGKKSLATPKKLTEVSPGASLYDENGKLIGTAPTAPADASKPITQEVGDTLLQWNPTTKAWDSIYTAPTKATDQKIVKIDGVDYVQNADGSYTKPTVPVSDSISYGDERKQLALNKIDDLVNDVNRLTSGFSGQMLSKIGGTDAFDLKAKLTALGSNLAFSELQAMRDASKTGGALGQVSERELALLEGALGSLNIGQSKAQLLSQLEQIKSSINNFSNAVKQNATNTTSTKMIGPDGLTYNVPNDQVDAFISDGGKRFNNVGGDTNKAIEKTVTKAESVVDNTEGGECGSFVKRVAGIQMGNKYEEKLALMDKSIKTPQPGMVFVMPYSWTGHTGVILDVKDGIATVKHSNFNLDKQVTTDEIPVSKMTGFAYPKLS